MARDRGLPGDASTFALRQLRLLVQSQRHGPFQGDIVDFLENLSV